MQPTSSDLLQLYMSQHYKWNLFAALQFNKIQFHNFLPRHPREIIFLSRWIRFILAASRLLAALHHSSLHCYTLSWAPMRNSCFWERIVVYAKKKELRQKRCKSEEWYGEITKKSVGRNSNDNGSRVRGEDVLWGKQEHPIEERKKTKKKLFFFLFREENWMRKSLRTSRQPSKPPHNCGNMPRNQWINFFPL